MKVSQKEIENTEKVLGLLAQIPGIGYTQNVEDRPDIITVSISDEDGDIDLVIDVEDTTVITMAALEVYPEGISGELAIKLLQANNSAVHGAFVLTPRNELVFKSNLEVENLDLNELEASIRSVAGNSYAMLVELANEEGE